MLFSLILLSPTAVSFQAVYRITTASNTFLQTLIYEKDHLSFTNFRNWSFDRLSLSLFGVTGKKTTFCYGSGSGK